MCAFATAGNYRTFNLATVLVTIPLLDDRTFHGFAFVRRRILTDVVIERSRRGALYVVPLVVFLLAAGTLDTIAVLFPSRLTTPWRTCRQAVQPYHSANGYALFAHVRRERPVIVIEVSRDGVTWEPVDFHTNPGALDEPLTFLAPYHHFLDFIDWGFAFLSPADHPHIVASTARGLLAGRDEILGLFERVPFGEHERPLALRFELYEYRYASSDERRAGLVWRREYLRPWCPPLTLVAGELVPSVGR